FALSETRPYQLGLTWHRGWQNLGLGVVAALILTPLVVGIQYLAVRVFQSWTEVPVQDHPLFGLPKSDDWHWFEWIPLLLQILLVAPLLEELFFRGLLQP